MTYEQAEAEYNNPQNRGISDGWKSVSTEACSALRVAGWETKDNGRDCYARPTVEYQLAQQEEYREALIAKGHKRMV